MGQAHSTLHLSVTDKPLRMLADICQLSRTVTIKVDPSVAETFGEIKGATSNLTGRSSLVHFIVRASAANHSSGFLQRLPSSLQGFLQNVESFAQHKHASSPKDTQTWFAGPESVFEPENLLGLLGNSVAEQASVESLLAYEESKLTPALQSDDAEIKSRALQDFAAKLVASTFLVEHHLTLADLMAYASLYSTVAAMVSGREPLIPDIARYFDLIQRVVLEQYDKINTPPVYEPINLDYSAVAFAPHVPPVKAKKKPADATVKGPASEGKKGQKKVESSALNTANSSKKIKTKDAAKQPAPVAQVVMDPSCLQMIVAKVESVERHPDADALYVEQMDLGFEKRTVISGLVKHMTEDQLQGKTVILLANLKPAKMRGIESQAMVLCATDEKTGTLELVQPPEGAALGTMIYVEGFKPAEGLLAQLNPKKKQFETIQPNFTTTADLIPAYVIPEGQENAGKVCPFVDDSGRKCKVQSIVGASIK